jgi:predicted RNA polymerase sigma factor
MKRTFVDTDVISSRKMSKDGNIDYQFWFDKSIEERLAAAVAMIEVSFNTTNFTTQKVDRNVFTSFKRKNL